jgi:hypothetical protein
LLFPFTALFFFIFCIALPHVILHICSSLSLQTSL